MNISELNVVISGPDSSGKTTLQSVISKALRDAGYIVGNEEVGESRYEIENKLSAWRDSLLKSGNDGRTVKITCLNSGPGRDQKRSKEVIDLISVNLEAPSKRLIPR